MEKCSYNVKICIIGMGIAGLGYASKIAESALAGDSLIVECGSNLQNRGCNIQKVNHCLEHEPCNMISGLGGCSYLSGSKISSYPAGKKMGSIVESDTYLKEKMAETLSIVESNVKLKSTNIPKIQIEHAIDFYKEKGFDFKYYDSRCFDIEDFHSFLKKTYNKIYSSGIQTLFETNIEIIKANGNKFELHGSSMGAPIIIYSDRVVIATGRNGRKLIEEFNQQLKLNGKQNYIDIGVRLEFPSSLIQNIDEHHNDLKLLFNNSRTYCVCKEGRIVSYCIDGVHFTEGHYDLKEKTGFTNLAILTRLKSSYKNKETCDYIKQKCKKISSGKIINQNLNEYLGIDGNRIVNDKTYTKFINGNINECFPSELSAEIRESVEYFISQFVDKAEWEKIEVFAPEINNEGLCFELKNDFSVIENVHIIGECTGKFRGILQSFCSGLICAEMTIDDGCE